MGLGDEIMAAGEARWKSRAVGKPVRIIGKDGRSRASEMWIGLDYITVDPSAPALVNGPGCRPYIDYAKTTEKRWAYTNWRCTPGEISGIKPLEAARGAVIIEPNIKPNASPNKQWGGENWQALVDLNPHLDWVQLGGAGCHVLRGVRQIATATFREACGALLACKTAVLPEGGLHHAAAALNKRVVVLFGGMTSPRNTGYYLHTNLAVDDPEALGWRIPHPACHAAWQQITPKRVSDALAIHIGAPKHDPA